MMAKRRYLVIIPTLNEERFVGKLLESLGNQTEKNFDVVVVDGGSTDKTIAVVNQFRQKLPSLTVLKSKEKGPSVQRNLGAGGATNEWLVFVDADSVLLPYFFTRVSEYIEKNHPSALTTWCRPDSEVVGDAFIALLSNMTIESSMAVRRPIAPGPLTVVLKSAFDMVGGYDREHQFGEDVDLGKRLTNAGFPIHMIRETLYVFSLRRFRREGTLRVLQKFAYAAITVLLIKRTPKSMPGYTLGGALYQSKNSSHRRSFIRAYETRLRKFIKEWFE